MRNILTTVILTGALSLLALGCADELTGGGGSDEGFCRGTASGRCATDADCMVGTRCIDATFCAVYCTSDDQCGGMGCSVGGGGGEPDAPMPDTPVEPDVDPDNNPPSANGDTFEIPAGEDGAFDVLANDTDPDGDELDILEVTQPAHGTVVAIKGQVEYTSNDPEFIGTDSFEYTAEDGRGGTSTATVTLNIIDPPPPPTLIITSPEEGAVIEGDTVQIAFEANGCNFTFPSRDAQGCHGHKFLNGERWTDPQGDNFGHYETGDFNIFPLEPGIHEITFVLVLNDGSDQPFDPQISDTITIEVVEEPVVIEVAQVEEAIESIQLVDGGATMLLGTPSGVRGLTLGSNALSSVYVGGGMTSILQDPFDTARYYGSGSNPGRGFEDWGFVESRDTCETWSEVSLTGEATFTRLAASPDQAGILAAVSGQRLYTSSNTGRTWRQDDWPTAITGLEIVNPEGPVVLLGSSAGIEQVTLPDVGVSPLFEGDVTALDRHPEGFVYGTAEGGLALCDPGFTDCTSINGPGEAAIQIVVAPEAPATLYVLTDLDQLYVSSDSGETWDLIAVGQ